MDITAVSQPMPVAVAPAAGPAPMARGPVPGSNLRADGAAIASVELEVAARRIVEAAAAAEGAPLPPAVLTRAELGVDEGSRRVFARLVDRRTGEVVREYPPDELLRLFAMSREQFDHLFRVDV